MSGAREQGTSAEVLLASVAKAMDHEAYRALFNRVVEERSTTGPERSEDLVAYTKLNLARTVRNEKTVQLLPQAAEVLGAAPAMTWLVLTETWCGDSSQVLPVIAKLAEAAPQIHLRILLRDEHPGLMGHYLTKGGRSIPKLIAVAPRGEELFTWGPRPRPAQDMVWADKALPEEERMGKDALYAKVHAWYAADKGVAVQQELLELITAVSG